MAAKINPDTHIYLYAKGHYDRTYPVENLRKVIGERYQIPPIHISGQDIILVLSNIAYTYINDPSTFANFLLDIHPDNFWMLNNSTEYDYETAAILKLLSVLRYAKAEGLNLGNPDSSILPLANS